MIQPRPHQSHIHALPEIFRNTPPWVIHIPSFPLRVFFFSCCSDIYTDTISLFLWLLITNDSCRSSSSSLPLKVPTAPHKRDALIHHRLAHPQVVLYPLLHAGRFGEGFQFEARSWVLGLAFHTGVKFEGAGRGGMEVCVCAVR